MYLFFFSLKQKRTPVSPVRLKTNCTVHLFLRIHSKMCYYEIRNQKQFTHWICSKQLDISKMCSCLYSKQCLLIAKLLGDCKTTIIVV